MSWIHLLKYNIDIIITKITSPISHYKDSPTSIQNREKKTEKTTAKRISVEKEKKAKEDNGKNLTKSKQIDSQPTTAKKNWWKENMKWNYLTKPWVCGCGCGLINMYLNIGWYVGLVERKEGEREKGKYKLHDIDRQKSIAFAPLIFKNISSSALELKLVLLFLFFSSRFSIQFFLT